MDITVFLGAPGSGKGTQAKRLAESQGFSHFSTGDMLRAAIKNGTPVGMNAKQFIDKGALVPDDTMIALIESTLAEQSSSNRILLDGFPRTVPQAKALDSKPSTRVGSAIFFEIPEKVLVERLTGRRICKNCGSPYHVHFLPPKKNGKCDRCGGDLVQRADDQEEVVKKRLEVFRQQNDQLLSYYGEVKKLHELDANQPVDTVERRLTELLQ